MRRNLDLVPEKKKRFVSTGAGLCLNTETGVYYVRKTFRRYRIPDLFESTHEETIGRAKAKATELISAHLEKYLGHGHKFAANRYGKRVSEIIKEILEREKPKKRKRTQENYDLYLGELDRELGKYDINRLTVDAWDDWLGEFRTRKNRKTFFDYAVYMNLVFRYAAKKKYASHLIILPNPDKVRAQAGRVFTQEEIARLWDAMSETTKDQFALSYSCFMRLREGLFLTWDRVNFETNEITLRAEDVKTGSRTGRGRTLKMSPDARERLLARFQKQKGVSPFVFPSRENPKKPQFSNKTAWIQAKRRAGITGRARWHDLRHSALTHALLDLRSDPLLVSEYAGVSLRTIQRVYLHSTSEKTASVAKLLKIKV